MSKDFRDESEAHEFIAWHLGELGRTYKRRRIPGLGLPDIDVLLEAEEIVGYEVKYFPNKDTAKPYEGIGEALAILLYGLDSSYLVHVFDSSIEREAERVRSQALKLVGFLPVGYAYCVGRSSLKVAKRAQANPFLRDPDVMIARKKLLEILQ